MQDNVALIVVLEARDTGGFMDSQAASGKRGQLLCVVSILSWTEHKYVRINGQGIAAGRSMSNYWHVFNH
jgi:hypothetical protein